ncbi:MAG TPA: type II toxin-antitoxin system HicA family toxin [Chloroflexota bacterium]|nr:type II toxin-antitoxin system HicA family toxin [Chloroflexota bacterium]
MPVIGPITRDRLIRSIRQLGFTGPHAGGSHSAMRKGNRNVPVPNPHQGDIDVALLRRILRVAGISRDEWESL